MKTILLFMCSLLLISQTSFGKEINTKASAGNRDVKLERTDFINSSVSKKAVIERNRIWLNFSNAEGAFKQQLIGYVTGATNGWDKLYDAVTLDSNPYVDFYSINGGKNLTIQGRGLPFVTTDEVPLGYKSTMGGTFEISIDHVDGLFVTQDIFLKDLTTGTIHNLKSGAYSFTTLIGRFNDRFVLLYINAPVAPAPPIEPIVTVVTEPVVTTPEVPVPVVTVPVVTTPEVPVPVVTEPVVTVPVVTVPVVTEPVVTVPEVPIPVVTDPVVTTPEVPVPVVTEPVVTVPEVPVPVVTEPVVTTPEVPVPVVTEPVVTTPEVPVPVVTEPVVTIPEVPVPVVSEPVVTTPEVPVPVVTEPVVTTPEIPVPVVTEPVVTTPEVPVPVVIEPVVTTPEIPVPVVTEPVVTTPEVPVPVVTEPVVTIPVVPVPVVTEPVVIVPEVPAEVSVETIYGGKGKSVFVSVNNNQITINSAGAPIDEISVYSFGQIQLFNKNNINSKEFVINDLGVAKQMLIIKTQLKNGKSTTSKVIL
ncbi:hypothetical protein [Flavobacterium sp. HJJ]|uniref:hypothetical protein n=1 Tax=Flavobacterium sp. HJJ TaxID=2783792 RepID=UPI00188C8002|nr:hypothetical protein [Flavobacterium sp. HJJ]MBF4472654.1 hypothetical protein [Flavobacterium sp. HJJ]